mgnify:CR=1 FL=1
MSEENKMTLEERFDCLEDILEKMEESGVTLDQSFELYKSGVEQVKACNACLLYTSDAADE